MNWNELAKANNGANFRVPRIRSDAGKLFHQWIPELVGEIFFYLQFFVRGDSDFKMSIIVKGSEPKTVNIEDGLHIGVIQNIEERTPEGKNYTYLDLHIALEGKEDIELKVGYSLPNADVGLNKNQDLGKLVKRMTGKDISVGADYDLEALLKGKKVQFQTVENDNGYSEIIKPSVKPVVFQTTGDKA